MRAQVGDEIVVESQSLGRPARRGRVQEILGGADTEHFRVRWDDGHESVYYPGADGHVVRPIAGVPVQPTGTGERGIGVTVGDVAAPAERLDGHATLRTAAAVLARSTLGAVVVQDPGSPPAVLTAHDVLTALAAGADPEVVWAADIAPATAVWVAADEDLARAADGMRDQSVTHALVRDRNGLLGVVALGDLLAGIVDARVVDDAVRR